MKKNNDLDFCLRLAPALAKQFGDLCEVVVHDLRTLDPAHSIVAIENGHISGRKVGDGCSRIVLQALQQEGQELQDRLSYLTTTEDGRYLKSSTIFLRDDDGRAIGIFSVNYDVSLMLALEKSIHSLTAPDEQEEGLPPQKIRNNVTDLLQDLIEQSVRLVGRPVAVMTKEDKIRAIRFLHDSGAFLITKSGPKVCAYFGISKYTLYNYLDEIKSEI